MRYGTSEMWRVKLHSSRARPDLRRMNAASGGKLPVSRQATCSRLQRRTAPRTRPQHPFGHLRCRRDTKNEMQNRRQSCSHPIVFDISANARGDPRLPAAERRRLLPVTTSQKSSWRRKTPSIEARSHSRGSSPAKAVDDGNKEFGQGAAGFGRYIGTAYGDLVIGNYMSEAVFPTLLP